MQHPVPVRELTCKTGFYGTRCDLSCSPNCAANINGVISCSKDLGLCDEQRCRPGYWDTTCTIQCSAACLRDSAGNRICQFSNGTCIVGCEDTYFGSECDSAGCVTGRYGDRCEFSCLDTCNDNTCGRTSGVCDECNKLPQLQSALCRTAVIFTLRLKVTGFPVETKTVAIKGGFHIIPNNAEQALQVCFATCHVRQTARVYVAAIRRNAPHVRAVTMETHVRARAGIARAESVTKKTELELRRTCFRGNGECDIFEQGRWGTTCSANCSTGCSPSAYERIYCNKTSGVCVVGACSPGFYNIDCTARCDVHCRTDGNGKRNCNFLTGVCRDGCEAGFYSDFCDKSCGENCQGNVCERTGQCFRDLGCRPGFYGPTCSLNCTTTCTDDACNIDDGMCDECKKVAELQTPLCRSAGTNCEVRCPLNCVSSCHRYSAKCDVCPAGYWNLTCNSRCGQCSINVCNQTTAVCLGDCNPGYYGDTCNTSCPFPGAATCERLRGASVTCKPGLYGQNCLSNCSRNCLPSSGGQITCNKLSGSCDSQQQHTLLTSIVTNAMI
ncbi:hypothetical protein DPMN_038704 [Dreissena polymorpha]|uniref:EGF-like domain-containing protein n=1 Tax=Dreissena polymorpha TaxID=45954 RepID=A0A9D4MF56_DREPO|nr:hypothetical protein DPMN_038704 [Dreissena polymorpha]